MNYRERDSPKPNLTKLRRHAVEDLGVSLSDPICRDIEHLGEVWNPLLYEHVQRRLARLDDAREGNVRFADRVPPPGTFDGAVPVAFAPTPSGNPTAVSLNLWELILHVVVAGLPGRGKTYFCRLLVTLLARLFSHINIVIFDPNRSYTTCCSDPGLWLSISWHDLRLNPIAEPLGYPDDMWRAEFIDRFARDELLHSKYLLARCLDELVVKAKRDSTAGADYVPPSLVDLHEQLATLKFRFNSREAGYRESSLNVLDGRLRTSGHVYDCGRGMEAALSATRVRIDTQGLAPVESLQFCIESILHYAYRLRCAEAPTETPSLHTLIVIEEAQTLLERRLGRPIAFYEEMLLRSRSLGLAFVFIVQDISRVDPTVLAACSNFVVFGQVTAENRRTIHSMLDLSHREAAMLGELQVGECFMRLANSQWPHPFIGRVPSA